MFNNWIEVFKIEDDQKERKGSAGYNDKNHFTKTKRSTGVKLASSVQLDINTSLMSNQFTIPQFQYLVQLRINEHGAIMLNAYMSQGLVSLGVIARITGSHKQQYQTPSGLRTVRIFDYAYVKDCKLASPKLDKQIMRFLAKCNKDVVNFLAKMPGYAMDERGDIVPYVAQATPQQQNLKKLIGQVKSYNPRR